MAEVHIVDIDGEQWDIKDLPLTERVTNLETSVNTNIPNRFARDEKKIDGIYTIAHGNSIQECCNKLGYEYDQYGIAYAIAAVFNNPGAYPTGIYSISIGGPAFLFMVQTLGSDYMSIFATGYGTPDLIKATKTQSTFSFGVIKPTKDIA